MDEITEVENEISLLRGEVNVLRRQLERVCQALDETRRRVGLSNIIDDATLLSYIWGLWGYPRLSCPHPWAF